MSQPVSLDPVEIDAIRPWRPVCALCLAEREQGRSWGVPAAEALVQGTAMCARHARMAVLSSTPPWLHEDDRAPGRGQKSPYASVVPDH
jgi:hypothetical protein